MSADPSSTSGKPWWKNGVQFQCQGSGKCCVSHGEYGFVFLTLKDRQRIARHLKISTAEFTRTYCDRQGSAYHLKEDSKNPNCLFLREKRCGIYEARPVQCRTWPFWPEVMNPKTWAIEVAGFCPGVGKGPVISAEEIRRQLDEQAESEKEIWKE
jgi:Fe-S-cluster containining protein